jgi:hypothetical protein
MASRKVKRPTLDGAKLTAAVASVEAEDGAPSMLAGRTTHTASPVSAPESDNFSTRVFFSGNAISVSIRQTLFQNGKIVEKSVGVAEASYVPVNLGVGVWYVNRVLVTNPSERGSGVGSYMLTVLKASLQRVSNFQALVVDPGGYGADPTRQANFYKRNGFRQLASRSDQSLIWKPAQP